MAVASLGNIGSATGSGTTLTIPITTTIPRSDPITGATIIILYVLTEISGGGVSGQPSDDGATDPFYGTCLFSDGLNHYTEGPGFNYQVGDFGFIATYFGLIMNPLDSSNSITINLGGTATWAFASARAYTGVNVDTSGTFFPGVGTDAGWMFTGDFENCPCGVAFNDTFTSESRTVAWDYFPAVNIEAPFASTDGNWTWDTGELAFWIVSKTPSGDAGDAWTWGDTDIVTQDEYDDLVISGGSEDGLVTTVLYAEQPISAPQSGITLAGSWGSGASLLATNGGGGILLAGPGPTCPVIPPPPFNGPVFNHMHRAGD